MIEATDPIGGTEHMEFHWSTTAIPSTAPSSEVPTGFESANRLLNYYNAFYWDKRPWKTAPGDVTPALGAQGRVRRQSRRVHRRAVFDQAAA